MIPEIREERGIPTLYVNEKPFFIRGGEIHNSSASSLEYMAEKVWPALRELHMNTVIVPVYWETVEAEEGSYDWKLVDGLIDQAKNEGMHLVFLWFGLWKNAESMYIPGWMKKNPDLYFHAVKRNGEPLETVSPFCEAAVEKDADAFANLMIHIREKDEENSTVIMMQVENEIGLLGTERDYGKKANEIFEKEVPAEIAELCGKEGCWKEVFGEDAEEAFMAYFFAGAVEKITKTGRKEYPLPCYANAWLKQYPWYAGSYPSGGPVKEVHKIWKKAAPSLFTLAPDIYVPYVADVMDEYGYEGNPLMIPEVRKDAVTASYGLYAFAGKNAIGYSPFGIEKLALSPEEIEKPPMEVMLALNIDPSAFDVSGSKNYLRRMYEMAEAMEPLYLKYRGTGKLKSYIKSSDTDAGCYFHCEEYDIIVSYTRKTEGKPLASGIIYELAPDRFLIGGMMSSFTFRVKAGENKKVGIVRMEEGEIVNGEWKAGRILNGDEKMKMQLGDMPEWRYVEVYRY